jgi:hypothetical protein
MTDKHQTEGKAMKQTKETLGLKRLTNAGSIPLRLDKGGKDYVRDTSKKRLYKAKGE